MSDISKKKFIVIIILAIICIAILLFLALGDNVLSYFSTKKVIKLELSEDGKSYVLTKVDNEAIENKNIVLPNTYKGKPVVAIADDALASCTNIVKLYIPKNVTQIPATLTQDCSKLAEIEVSRKNKLYSSLDGVLYNKEQTEILYIPQRIQGTVEISSHITDLSELTFPKTNRISKIVLSETVETVGDFLDNFKHLEKIKVKKENPNFSSYDGVLYNKEQTEMLYIPNSINEKLVLSPKVEDLSEVEVPSDNYVTKLVIGKSVKNVGAFLDDLRALEKIKVKKANEHFSSYDGVLYNKEQTEMLHIPNLIIGTLEISPKVEDISGVKVPSGNNVLKVVIGEKVKNIGSFLGKFNSLEKIVLSKKNDNFCLIDGNLYNKDGTVLIRYVFDTKVKKFVVDKDVEEICVGAFVGGKLTSIEFDDGENWYKITVKNGEEIVGDQMDLSDVEVNAIKLINDKNNFYRKQK